MHNLKKYLSDQILKEYINDIEMYGYIGDKYFKLSDQIIHVVESDVKNYLVENNDNKIIAEKIKKSKHLYYSKKLHGDRMLKSILPQIIGKNVDIILTVVIWN